MESIVGWVSERAWLILFVAWGIPLSHFRSRFRKIVYRTDSWTINIKPYFVKETVALFKNLYPEDPEYLRMRNFYRFYLAVYLILFVSWRFFG